MNSSDIISLIIQAITAFAAITALFLVITQIHQFNESQRSQVYQGLINNVLEIDKLLIDKPELRKYIYADTIVTKDLPEVNQIMSLIEMIIDVVDNLGAQSQYIPNSERAGWRKYSNEVLSSPAANFFFNEHGAWYSGNVSRMLKQNQYKEKGRFLQNILNSFCHKPIVKSLMSPKTSIQDSQIHGLGIFTREIIKQGEIVLVKGGHILTRDELFSSEKINSYLPIDDKYFIGARYKYEEPAVKLFINHSCDPNCGIRGEITFVATRDIQVGEEITLDYAMIDNEDYSFECHCKSACCRKTITGFDWKLPELQKKYGEYFARYLVDKINENRVLDGPSSLDNGSQ